MTVFRILPSGHRRRLPDGSVRALGASRSRYFDVSGSTSFGVDASGRAIPSVPMVGETWVSFEISATLTYSGTIGLFHLSVGIAGVLSGAQNMRGATMLGVDMLGTMAAMHSIRGATSLGVTVNAALLPSHLLRGSASLNATMFGRLAAPSPLRGGFGLGFALNGAVNNRSSAKWRELWRDVYQKRQALLDAIDAKNRELAEEAEGKATATAEALDVTVARVEQVNDRVTAEAERTTTLTSRVVNTETAQAAQGTAISNLQATQTSQGNTLTSHSQQLVNVNASITTLDGKTTTNANATTALTARVVSTEAGVARADASWNVTLAVGNLVSGLKSTNNGTIAEFNVSANVFRVVSPSGAPSGMEWQNGYLRSWKQDTQVIMGNGFGASNDLMFYAGPNVGVGNATKANAVFWIDSAGVAYFAGEVLQGTLRNFQSNTTVSNTATVSTGSVARKGKEVAVTGRFQYQYMQSYQGLASQITLAGGNTVATICIEYRYGTGAWVELSRVTIAGSDYVLNESDAPSVITQSISGQVFATAGASTTNTEFRTRVISIQLRQHTVTNPGTVPPAVRSQYQSIESLE